MNGVPGAQRIDLAEHVYRELCSAIEIRPEVELERLDFARRPGAADARGEECFGPLQLPRVYRWRDSVSVRAFGFNQRDGLRRIAIRVVFKR